MVDRLRYREQFLSEIPDIQRSIIDAVRKTQLSSTKALCYYINWSIAVKLRTSLNASLVELRRDTMPGMVSSPNPTIAFVPNGYIRTPDGFINHSFPIVFGVEDSPILVDGSNDQQDPSRPFLVRRLSGALTFDRITAVLEEAKHPMNEKGSTELDQEQAERGMGMINLMFQVGMITEEQRNTAYEQYRLEKSAGCAFLFLQCNRDWITYFMKSLGIEYPSTQDVQDRLFATVVQLGFPDLRYKEDLDRTLAELAKKLLEESK
jgi:hypothetical protein